MSGYSLGDPPLWPVGTWPLPIGWTPKIPYKCPVCDGTGLVSKPPGIAGDQETWTSSGTGPYQCLACNGERIVWS